MVEAIELHTVGLGGDSEVRVDGRDLKNLVLVGPRRAIPIARLALEHPDVTDRLLDQAATSLTTAVGEIRFVVPTGVNGFGPFGRHESALLERLGTTIASQATVAPGSTALRALDRLIAQGVLRIATFTPTDALHVLGKGWGLDTTAAKRIAALAASRQGPTGAPIAPDGEALASQVIALVGETTAKAVLDAGFSHAGLIARSSDPLVEASLARSPLPTLRVEVGLDTPLVGVGASAAALHRRAADQLRADLVVPDHAEVANAIGAAIADVVITGEATITQPRRGKFVVHLDDQPAFGSPAAARDLALERLFEAARKGAVMAGATDLIESHQWEETVAVVDGKEWLVEGVAQVSVSGRPSPRLDAVSQHSGDGGRITQ